MVFRVKRLIRVRKIKLTVRPFFSEFQEFHKLLTKREWLSKEEPVNRKQAEQAADSAQTASRFILP
jgi:hypothetical protein